MESLEKILMDISFMFDNMSAILNKQEERISALEKELQKQNNTQKQTIN